MSGIATVQSRIAEIEGLIQTLRTPATTTATSASSTTASATFAGALDAALAAGSSGSTSASSAAASGASGAAATSGTSGTSGASGLTPATGTATATDLITAAKKYLGVPYVWGGEDASGMDCSGLVQRAFADLGITVPRVARQQMNLGTAVPSLDQARPGDLIVQRDGGHIGIYMGNNQMLHAPQPGDVVKIGPIYSTPTAIRRVLPAGDDAVTAAAFQRAALALGRTA